MLTSILIFTILIGRRNVPHTHLNLETPWLTDTQMHGNGSGPPSFKKTLSEHKTATHRTYTQPYSIEKETVNESFVKLYRNPSHKMFNLRLKVIQITVLLRLESGWIVSVWTNDASCMWSLCWLTKQRWFVRPILLIFHSSQKNRLI